MRITEIECEFTDLLWFAIDKNGVIGAFASGGTGHIPEMICQSKEIPALLEQYFVEHAPIISQCIFTPEQGMKLSKTCSLYHECLDLSSKGLFCYDASDHRIEKKRGITTKCHTHPSF